MPSALPSPVPPAPPHSAARRFRLALGALVVVWGAQAIVTQSLLLREALVLMFGSEFAWGVVLFAWLLGVAVGGALGGWLSERVRRPDGWLVGVLMTLSAVACGVLWVFRGARAWLGVGPGELLPLPTTVLAALLLVTPGGVLVGLAFPLACRVRDGRRAAQGGALPRTTADAVCLPHDTETSYGMSGATDSRAGTSEADAGAAGPALLSFGQVYALESAGSLIGGALFSFWVVEHLAPIQTALVCAGLTAASCAVVLARERARLARSRGRVRLLASLMRLCSPPVVLGVLALAELLLAALAGDMLNRRLVERRWRLVAPRYELVAETESRYQNLALGRLAGQYTLYCDGQATADFPDPYTFVPLAHLWMCQHPEPRRVLLLGGGAEGLLSEILRYPVEQVDYVELDPRQIELLRPHLDAGDRRALDDPRVTVHHSDVRHFVKTQRGRFELVIARLPEPTSALRARLYTDEFWAELRRAMTARCVLCLTASAAPGELSPAVREYLAGIRATLRRHFAQVVVGWGNPAQVLAASDAGLLALDPDALAERYARSGVESPLFHPAWFRGATDWLDPDKLARRSAELDAIPGIGVSTDLHPAIYLQRLALWEAATSGGVGPGRTRGGVFAALRSVSLGHIAAVLGVIAVLTLVTERLRRRSDAGWASGAVVVSVGTTGLATMALSIIWLFAFQNLYGYVYQRIGWIIALFMAGLVVGCLLTNRWPARGSGSRRSSGGADRLQRPVNTSGARQGWCVPCGSAWRGLILVDLLLAGLAGTIPVLLPALGALQTTSSNLTVVEWCISLLVVATGVLGGAAFPLAGQLQTSALRRTGAAVGSVVAADHAGACLGAVLCGILLVPVFGTATAAVLLAAMKLTSAGVLVFGYRFRV